MASEVTEYSARTASEDVDCIEICPAYPDFLIYGTYSLVGKDAEYVGQIRKGTIQVLPVADEFKPTFPGMMFPHLAKASFPAAVLDIHFHSADSTLLGVALSNSEVRFFRFIKRGDILSRRVITELLPLGHAKIAEKDEYGVIPLVTQFCWFPHITRVGRRDVNDELIVTLAATFSSYQVKIIKLRIPGIKSTHDHRLSRTPPNLQNAEEEVHTHDLEAWTVNFFKLPEFTDHATYQLLSGADDSALIASKISLSTTSDLHDLFHPENPPAPAWKDTKSHGAGVTAILPLLLASDQDNSSIPLLTGSYDESLRLFFLNTTTNRRNEITSLSLRGGVWRLKLMDSYATPLESRTPTTATESTFHQHHYVVLVSCMHAGAKIIRLTHDPHDADGETKGWKLKMEALFQKGHETLVYACDFRREWEESPQAKEGEAGGAKVNAKMSSDDNGDKKETDGGMKKVGLYTIVSTSFYDRQICVWQWRDEKRKDAVRT